MPSDTIRLRTMTLSDLPLGMRLKDVAGWNQTQSDWQRFLALAPEGGCVAECDGEPVGTAVGIALGEVGWIAMVLVDPAYRGRGIGTRLVEQCVAHLERGGARSVRLDATPLGRPVYERLGFQVEYELARWEGTAPAVSLSPRVVPVAAEQLDAVVELDRQITATSRRSLIEPLFHQQPGAMRAVVGPQGLLGYATWRDGSRAAFLGPAMSLDAEVGRELADAALAACAGRRVFVDIPRTNAHATRWAESCGFTVQRPLFRMVRGLPVADRPDSLWASSGPECG